MIQLRFKRKKNKYFEMKFLLKTETAVARWLETARAGTNRVLTEEDLDHFYCTIQSNA